MQLHELVNTFGQDLKQRHGQKIHKLSIHGAFTCPNRDGTLGRGGCTFCTVSSFADESAQQLSVVQQLLARRDEVTRPNVISPTFRLIPAPMPRWSTCSACMKRRCR